MHRHTLPHALLVRKHSCQDTERAQPTVGRFVSVHSLDEAMKVLIPGGWQPGDNHGKVSGLPGATPAPSVPELLKEVKLDEAVHGGGGVMGSEHAALQ